MKATLSLLALSALALAAPSHHHHRHNHKQHKREVVVVTSTSEVIETVYSTKTIWVQPTADIQAPDVATPPPSAPSSSSSSSSSVDAASNPGGEFYELAAVTKPAPVPTPEFVPAPPKPTTTEAPPAPSPVAPELENPAPASSSSSGASDPQSSPSGQTYTGEITYYDPGMGSCGESHSSDEMIAAVAFGVMKNGANPNANPLCGKTITISYKGKQTKAKVVDTCPGCTGADLDLSPSLFKAVAPSGDGRVAGVEWWFD